MKTRTRFALVLMSVILVLVIFVSLAQAAKMLEVNTTPPTITWWVVNHVDQTGDIGAHVSIAFDGETPWISYYDVDNTSLKVAHYVGSGGNCGPASDWYCEAVDSNPDVGTYSSIDIYRSGVFPYSRYVGVAYYDATSDALMFIEHVLGTWTTAIILDDGVSDYGKYASMKYSSTGVPMIAYYVEGMTSSLGYAYRVSSGGNCGVGAAANLWHCETVDVGLSRGKYASLGYSSFAGNPYIAYYDGFNGNLKYAYYAGVGLGDCGTGNAWTCITVDGSAGDDVGMFTSIHIPTNITDKLQIAYYDATNGSLKYAKAVDGGSGNCGLGGNNMQCDTIESMGTGLTQAGISLAVDGNNFPIIAYRDGAKLKVAQTAFSLGLDDGNCGPVILFDTWQCTDIDSGILRTMAEYASIAFNPDGLPMIAYSENVGNISFEWEYNLKIAYQAKSLALPVVKKE